MLNLVIGDRYTIPQWEHTRHNGFCEVIDIGSAGHKEGKVRILFPDLTSPWLSKRVFEANSYALVRKGDGKIDAYDFNDVWVDGEQEYKYFELFFVWNKRLGIFGHSKMQSKIRKLLWNYAYIKSLDVG